MIKISDFSKGDRVRLLEYGDASLAYRRKLLSLGLTCGAELLVIRVAPLGCPVEVLVRDTFLALRKDEAIDLKWERL